MFKIDVKGVNQMPKLKNNSSLFLYTALIFFVAIIMIIIAFFGQNNLQKNQPIQADTAATSSITEKAAQLSEDNRILMEQNQTLQNEKKELTENNESLTSQLNDLQKEKENNDKLLQIYNYLYKGSKSKAREILGEIVPEELTETQTTFYNILVKKSK